MAIISNNHYFINIYQHLDSGTVPMLSVSTLLNDWMYNFR